MTSVTLFFDNKAVMTFKTEGKTLDFIAGEALRGKSVDLNLLKISVSSE